MLKRLFAKRTVHERGTVRPMTEAERKAFDQVFADFDRTFKSMDKLFDTIRGGGDAE